MISQYIKTEQYNNIYCYNPLVEQYKNTRRSGHYTPILLAPTEGWGALRALLRAFGPLFSSRRFKRRHTQFSVKIGPHRSK